MNCGTKIVSVIHRARQRARLSSFLRGSFAATLLALASAGGAAHAAERFWIDTLGGQFSDSGNWSATDGGAGGASVPAAADNANFRLANTYTVNFTAAAQTNSLLMQSGVVTFDLNGNSYLVTDPNGIQVGSAGALTGRLTVRDGSLRVDTAGDIVHVGRVAGSSGFLTISTAGRLGTGGADPTLFVGNGGAGTFAIEDSGRADVGAMTAGAVFGVTGTTTVSGANAELDVSGALTLGLDGTSSLTLQNGGKLTAASTAVLGQNAGSISQNALNSSGTTWAQTGAFTLGGDGNAILNIQGGALMTNAGAIAIGSGATGIGTGFVTGAGSSWNMASTLTIGSAGLGNFSVTSGATASTTGATTVASAAGSEGFVLVSGAGAKWSAAGITLGSGGTGKMTVSVGASVTASAPMIVGGGAAGSGDLTVTGAGSTLDVTGALTVASAGSGTMTVDTGGAVTATGALSIADPAGGPVGTLNFNGGTIAATGFSRAAGAAFNWTDGTLQLNGGALNNAGANLVINGGTSTAAPTLRMTGGATSSVANLPNLIIGTNRQGAVAVIGGSSMQTTTTSIGTVDTGAGALLVEGGGSSLTTTSDLAVGGTTAAAGGTGALSVGVGGTVNVGGALRLWGGGNVTLNGGTLAFNTLAPNGGKFTFNSGRVQTLANFNANSAALDAITGVNHVLGAGRTIDTGANQFNLQSSITVDSGTLQGAVLNISAGVDASIQSDAHLTFTGAINNLAGGRLLVANSTVTAGTTLANSGELRLLGGISNVNAASVTNTGLLTGSGLVNTVVTNSAAGIIRASAGDRLQFGGAAGSNNNNGEINANGGAIEFARPVANSVGSPSTGLITARDATFRFNGGLNNNGAMTFTSGVSDVFGNINNQNTLTTPGRIIVTAGAQATFFGDVNNAGSIQVSASGALESTAVFLGAFSGNGATGGGNVFLEGDVRPGFSPGLMSFGGDVSLGPTSVLNIEIAGTAINQFDRVTVAEELSLGGALKVALTGLAPAAGQSFDILNWGTLSGQFASIELPTLGGGLSWNASQLMNTGVLSIISGGGFSQGDFNEDGLVNGADLALWNGSFGLGSGASHMQGDANGDGAVDGADLLIWQRQEAAASQAAAGVVPEPAALAMGLAAAASLLVRRPRRNKG